LSDQQPPAGEAKSEEKVAEPEEKKEEPKAEEKSKNENPKSDGAEPSEKVKEKECPENLRPWIDDCIRRLETILQNPNIFVTHIMHMNEVISILQAITPIIMDEGSLAECDAPCKVVGDIHGQFIHMHMLFDLIGRVPQERMMLPGDYVDRGPHSVEVVLYLYCLKIRHPSRIFLLRGNHETPAVNKIYGFYAELINKFGYPGIGLWYDFQSVFNRIPLAGLIGKKVLCMHGGLSPELANLDTIRSIVRPCEPLDKGLLIDLLWSDPTNKGEGWFHSIRGISYMFGKAIVAQFCERTGVDLIIRAHQVVQDGYEFMGGRKLITVFSAPNYCNQFSNAAAVVCIDAELKVSFQQMSVPLAAGSRAKPAPVIAADPNEPKVEPALKKDYNNNTLTTPGAAAPAAAAPAAA
ncbi:hypothetical protein PFISCL1PPCAC_6827, partial [Pristionchus fissidentatus]